MDVPAGVTQEEGNTGFSILLLSEVLALIFLARRIQPFLSLVDREVEFCVLTISSFSTRWAFLFSFFSFSVRKIPFAGIELTSQRVRGYMVPLSYRGDRYTIKKVVTIYDNNAIEPHNNDIGAWVKRKMSGRNQLLHYY